MIIKSFSIAIFIALVTIFTAGAAFGQEPVTPTNPESQAEAPLPENSMATRIGIALPKANFFEEGVSSDEMAASIQEIIRRRFQGSGIEIVALDARLPQAFAAEAREKSCFYILQTTVLRKRSGARLNSISSPSSLNSGGARTVLYTAADLASTTKAKDEFTFEYNLISTEDDTVKAKNSFKTKAKTDGEDILSPVIEKMMQTILTAAK